MATRKIKLPHPGKILREEFMEPVGLRAYRLAMALDVPLPRVNDIVREKRSISAEMAVLLSAYFGYVRWVLDQSTSALRPGNGQRQGRQTGRPDQPSSPRR